MKELIEESYKFSKRLDDKDVGPFALHIVKWIVALKAAEAREATLVQECKELRALVKELEGMVPKWVPVSARSPDCSVNAVLVYDPTIAPNLHNIYSANVPWLTGPFSTATHWMPLPDVPKEEV